MHAWRFYQRLRLAASIRPTAASPLSRAFFPANGWWAPPPPTSAIRVLAAQMSAGVARSTALESSRNTSNCLVSPWRQNRCRIDGCGHEGVPRSDRAPHRQLHQGEDRTGTLAPRYRTGEVVSSRSWLRARSDLPSTSKTSAIRRHSPAPRIQPPHPRLAHHTERLRISPNLDKNLV
jgi:hypothetical protein